MTESTQASELMDSINRTTWKYPETIRHYSKIEGYTDIGEKTAIDTILDEVRGKPILDLGIGAGRTIPILRSISKDYTGIDYTPELIRAAQEKYPDMKDDLILGDARDLSSLSRNHYKLVMFSFNGIDSVNHHDRLQILKEVYRVLAPGGIFLFSSHNKNGPGARETFSLGVSKTLNPVKFAKSLWQTVNTATQTITNYLNNSKLFVRDPRYSIKNAAVHSHGLLIYYTDLESQVEQLQETGFESKVEIFENNTGLWVLPTDDMSKVFWFHFLARKPSEVLPFLRK